MTRATLYTVSAPSGAGKTSLVKALTEADASIHVSVSHTTRKPRPGEVNGVNYHFVSVDEFEAMIAQGQFFEYAKVFDNYYGTSATWAQQQLEAGNDVLLEIDWQGAAQIKAQKPETVAVFILPPSIAELQNRLTGRGQDSDEVIAKRLAEAQNEMQHVTDSDYVIINDDFDVALKELQAIFEAQRLSTSQQSIKHHALLAQLLAPID